MFHKILIPLHSSIDVPAALDAGRTLARRSGARVEIVQFVSDGNVLRELSADEARLERYAQAYRDAGVTLTQSVSLSSPVEGVARAVSGGAADLVLLSPERRDTLELLWYPRSSSMRLSHLSAPTLIWPSSAYQQTLLTQMAPVIAVPLDGQPLAERAIPFAGSLARGFHGTLLLVHVTPRANGSAGKGRHAPQRSLLRTTLPEITEYLNTIKRITAKRERVPVQTVVLHGAPETALVDFAIERCPGMIVVTTHSEERANERFFTGAITTYLLRHIPTPMLLVPPSAQPWTDDEPARAAVGEAYALAAAENDGAGYQGHA